MTHTAIAADAEVRRLRRLGEATYDWCTPNQPPMPPPRRVSAAAAVRSMVARIFQASTTAPESVPEGGAR